MPIFSCDLEFTGHVAPQHKQILSNSFMALYGAFTDICNAGLISLLNDEWDMLEPGRNPGDSDEMMLKYNRFISKHFQLVADYVNKNSEKFCFAPKVFHPRLFVDPDTADCRGRWHDVVFKINWESASFI